jgi:molybdopterin adenylyltransferase
MTLRVGILTVSDRVSRGEMDDRGGPAVEEALAPLGAEITARGVVPDERDQIEATLIGWADDEGIDLIFTTGGTGLSRRDVTPEAAAAVCDRLIPGIGEAMRAAGLAQTPMSMISRSIAGVRGTTLIVTLPGSPRGAAEGVQVVLPVLVHAADTLRGARH